MNRETTELEGLARANLLSRAAEAEDLGRALLDLGARLRGDAQAPPQTGANPSPDLAESLSPAPDAADRTRPEIDPASLARTASALLALRQRRLRHLGIALSGDAAWDILLSLFAARLARRQPSFDELCAAGGGYPATVRRWVTVLIGLGLVEPCGPPADPDQRLALTRKGELAMAGCLGALAETR